MTVPSRTARVRPVIIGGIVCAASSQVLYGPLYLVGSITHDAAGQAVLGACMAASWALGLVFFAWWSAPYPARRVAQAECLVFGSALSGLAAACGNSAARIALLCVGAAGGAVTAHVLAAVRRNVPAGSGDQAVGWTSAVWFGLLPVFAFALSELAHVGGTTAALWSLSALGLTSALLVGLVVDREASSSSRTPIRVQRGLLNERPLRLMIAILLLSGTGTVAGQTYAALQGLRLGLAPKWLSPALLLGVIATATVPRIAIRLPRSALLGCVLLAATGLAVGTAGQILGSGRLAGDISVVVVFAAMQVSAAAMWSVGQTALRRERPLALGAAEDALRQSAPLAGQLFALMLLPAWLLGGFISVCTIALLSTIASAGLLLSGREVFHDDVATDGGLPALAVLAAN